LDILSGIMPIIFIVVLFFLIIRIATVILKLTGLDENTARFQAISAFTGTGFTTKEAELIVDDPIRRKITTVLMILGKVGIVSVIGSLFFSFGKDNIGSDVTKILIIILSILLLYKFTTFKGFSRALNKFIEKKVVARGLIKQKL